MSSGDFTQATVQETWSTSVDGTAMASFRDIYSVEDLQDVASYILQDVLQ
jgi:mono/diheme cytochrome c family protein